MPSPQVEAEIDRLKSLLQNVLRYRGPGQGLRVGARALERQLGWAAGTLSRVLQGKIELRFRHLFDVLEAIGIPPEDFFELAYPKPSPSGGGAQELLELLESRGRRGPQPPDRPEAALTDDELERRILAALERLKIPLPREGGEGGS
jgi:transcriptional regulator with XRE-family HTH domain